MLLARHLGAVARFFRTKTALDVDDLVQETFTRLLAHRRKLRADSSVRAYLFTVARNLFYERHRRDARSPVIDGMSVSVADLDPSPSAIVRQGQDRRMLLEALRRIPIDSQIALELFYWEALSVAELATALEIPEGTVKSRLHRAREQLRARLEQLIEDREQLDTTLSDLDDWARRLKPEM